METRKERNKFTDKSSYFQSPSAMSFDRADEEREEDMKLCPCPSRTLISESCCAREEDEISLAGS